MFGKRWYGIALLVGFAVASGAPPSKQPYTTWSDYAGGADSMQYSALKQINKSNVSKLELAWFYPAPGPTGRFAFNPLIVDGVMFVAGKDGAIFAIDAATGKERWSHAVAGNVTVDVPHHSASGRVRLRDLAKGRLEDCGRGECLGRDLDRREARHRLLPAWFAYVRSLRRRSQGREPLRRLHPGARSADGQA